MIEITIKRKTEVEYKETVNFEIHKEPTQIKQQKNEYGGGSSEVVCYATTNEPREVSKFRTVETTLLSQQIEEEENFDLGMAIKAINNL